MKINQLLQQIVQQFQTARLHFGHGADNADDEAFALVCMALDLPFDDSVLSRKISETEQQKINYLVQTRIQTRKPLSYLTNIAYFAGLPFTVDERVLIPRSPFAELIENQFTPWINPAKVKNILDLCTGSGCMAIATALALPEVQVDATDISTEALAVAKINSKKFKVTHRVHLIQSDLFQHLPQKKYDLIISNPPYVSRQEMQDLPKEYHHEPQHALQTNDEGLEITLRILQDAKKYLTKQGVLIVEVGGNQAALEKRLPNVPFTWLFFSRGGNGVFALTADQLSLVVF